MELSFRRTLPEQMVLPLPQAEPIIYHCMCCATLVLSVDDPVKCAACRRGIKACCLWQDSRTLPRGW